MTPRPPGGETPRIRAATLRREWPAALVAVAAVLATAWPTLPRPWRAALGGAWTEAPGHLWGLWTAARGLGGYGPLWRVDPGVAWPEGFIGHLIDPSSLALFVPGLLVGGGGAAGATLGWNLLHAGAMALGCHGAWLLARRVVPGEALVDAAARAVGVAALGFAPFWAGQAWLGRSEYLACLLLPAQLALLLDWLDRGQWRAGLAATLLLGLVGSSTGYGGLFAALLLAPVGVVALARDRRSLPRLALVAAGALLVAAPALWALSRDPVASEKLSFQRAVGASPACALVRACAVPALEHLLHQPLVLGLLAPALVLAGLAGDRRRALPWAGLLAWLLTWGLAGQWLVAPAQALLPALGAVKEWARVGAVVTVPLAPAVALGARALLDQPRVWPRPLLAALLVVGLALDGWSYPRPAWPWARPTFPVEPPAGLVEVLGALPSGPVVTLPLERPLRPDQLARPGFHVLWARTHGRPVSASLDGLIDAAGRRSGLVQATARAEERVLDGEGPPTLDRRCLVRDARALAAAGYAGVVLVGRDERAEAVAALLERVLGAPRADREQARTWLLPEARGQPRWCDRGWERAASDEGPGRGR